MNYSIIATLGPASSQERTWQNLFSIPIQGIRINTSHLSLQDLWVWLERLVKFFRDNPNPLSITLDLQGSKWRTGEFSSFHLGQGESITLEFGATTDQSGVIPVPHRDFFRAKEFSDGKIILDDAKITLEIIEGRSEWVRAKVIRGGPFLPRKGITFSSCSYRQESLSEKDREIIGQTQGIPMIQYAISYIKDAEEMVKYRKTAGSAAYLIAKIERQSAVEEVLAICEPADELWLCRGDLGAEMGLRGMAEAVETYHSLLPTLQKPSLLAGQVLEHMTKSPTPTRSEVCYLYEALRRGYRGVVLSDETAIGDYPIESCRTAAMFF